MIEEDEKDNDLRTCWTLQFDSSWSSKACWDEDRWKANYFVVVLIFSCEVQNKITMDN